MFRIVTTAIAGVALFGGAALAEEARGMVEDYDAMNNTVTLESGQQYMLRDNFSKPALQAGRDVIIEYEMVDGERHVERLYIQGSPGFNDDTST